MFKVELCCIITQQQSLQSLSHKQHQPIDATSPFTKSQSFNCSASLKKQNNLQEDLEEEEEEEEEDVNDGDRPPVDADSDVVRKTQDGELADPNNDNNIKNNNNNKQGKSVRPWSALLPDDFNTYKSLVSNDQKKKNDNKNKNNNVNDNKTSYDETHGHRSNGGSVKDKDVIRSNHKSLS